MIWKLLKDYVHEFETANKSTFSNEAWQRIKQLESDIKMVWWAERQELVDAYEKEIAIKHQALLDTQRLFDAAAKDWQEERAKLSKRCDEWANRVVDLESELQGRT